MNQTFYKRASVSSKKALDSLFARYPKATLVSFETKKADRETARAASVKVGDLIYEATIRLAEFPPSEEGGEEEAPEPKEEKDEGGDEAPDDDAPEFDDKAEGEEGLGAPKKMNPQEETNHLLKQILDAIKGGGAPGGDLDLPDVGAPPKGGTLPPPHPAGPPKGGPGMSGGPLPPPAPPKAPMGGPAFSHYDPQQNEIVTIRRQANEKGNKGLIEEAAETFPTHKVARIQRTGSAVLNGKQYNLRDNNIAVVTLVRG